MKKIILFPFLFVLMILLVINVRAYSCYIPGYTGCQVVSTCSTCEAFGAPTCYDCNDCTDKKLFYYDYDKDDYGVNNYKEDCSPCCPPFYEYRANNADDCNDLNAAITTCSSGYTCVNGACKQNCPPAQTGTINAGCYAGPISNSHNVNKYCISPATCYECNTGYTWDGINCKILCTWLYRMDSYGPTCNDITTNGCVGGDVTSDTACCSGDCTGSGDYVKCVNDGICYSNLESADVDNDGIAGEVCFCSDGWVDCDGTSSMCIASYCGSEKWVASGETGVGEYNSKGAVECCGDDANEYYVDGICCNDPNDINQGGSCVQNCPFQVGTEKAGCYLNSLTPIKYAHELTGYYCPTGESCWECNQYYVASPDGICWGTSGASCTSDLDCALFPSNYYCTTNIPGDSHCCSKNGYKWDPRGYCIENIECSPDIVNCIIQQGFANCIFGGKACCTVQYGTVTTKDWIPKTDCIKPY